MFIYYISATLYIGTNRVPPTPYRSCILIQTPFDHGKFVVKQPNQDQITFNPFAINVNTLLSIDVACMKFKYIIILNGNF